MSRRTLTFHYVDVLPKLGPTLAAVWLRPITDRLREFLSQAALTVTGYLRPRPDPVLERMLRTAFTALDRELAEILGDRTPHGMRDLPKSLAKRMLGIFRTISAGKYPASCVFLASRDGLLAA
jgi:hypothetical protein